MNRRSTTTQLAIFLEDLLDRYAKNPGAVPSSYDAWEVGRHAARIEELGAKDAAEYYRTQWAAIYQRRASAMRGL